MWDKIKIDKKTLVEGRGWARGLGEIKHIHFVSQRIKGNTNNFEKKEEKGKTKIET